MLISGSPQHSSPRRPRHSGRPHAPLSTTRACRFGGRRPGWRQSGFHFLVCGWSPGRRIAAASGVAAAAAGAPWSNRPAPRSRHGCSPRFCDSTPLTSARRRRQDLSRETIVTLSIVLVQSPCPLQGKVRGARRLPRYAARTDLTPVSLRLHVRRGRHVFLRDHGDRRPAIAPGSPHAKRPS